MSRIYLDTSAATPLDPRVQKAMAPYLGQTFGNPSSLHEEGRVAAQGLGQARATAAGFLQAQSDEIIFTSGGTEANNLAIFGTAAAFEEERGTPGHIIVSAIEHPSVLEPCRVLERRGWRISYLPVTREGIVELEACREALSPDTVLVSVMFANNEIGTLQPLGELRKIIARQRKLSGTVYPYFHTDACQATRFYDLAVAKLGVDLLSINGAKIYGPKGSGLLYVRRGTRIAPLLYGGGQELGMRSGTEAVAAVVGLARALEICQLERAGEAGRLSELRDYFIDRLLGSIEGTELNGSRTVRLPHNLNLEFRDLSAENLVIELDVKGIAASTGSACSAPAGDESYGILALGKDHRQAASSIRFSLDRQTTLADIDQVLELLPPIVEKLRRVRL